MVLFFYKDVTMNEYSTNRQILVVNSTAEIGVLAGRLAHVMRILISCTVTLELLQGNYFWGVNCGDQGGRALPLTCQSLYNCLGPLYYY